MGFKQKEKGTWEKRAHIIEYIVKLLGIELMQKS